MPVNLMLFAGIVNCLDILDVWSYHWHKDIVKGMAVKLHEMCYVLLVTEEELA